MNAPNPITVHAIELEQPIGKFFLAKMKGRDLANISYSDVRRMEERDVEKYLGIQRPLRQNRVEEITQYILSPDATFPTAVIIAVDGKCAFWNDNQKTITFSPHHNEEDETQSIPFTKIAKILDGQHRVAALEEMPTVDFDLNVAIFVDIDISDQANIFATVNLAQTKVNKSLVYDLYDLAKSRSPQKTCHSIAVNLNAIEESPFYKKIKRLGVATGGRFDETLTQATFVEALLPFISSRPLPDRNLLLQGKRLREVDHVELRKTPFRNWFVEDKDEEIMMLIFIFFEAVEHKWPSSWKGVERGNILNRTNGFRALMRFFKDLVVAKWWIDVIPTKTDVQTILDNINIPDGRFSPDVYRPGTSGEVQLYRDLKSAAGI